MKKRLLSLLLCVAMLCAMFPSPALADDEEPAEPTLYTVTVDTGGGAEVDPQKIEAGGLVRRPDDPEKEHYSFADWYKEDTLENKWDFEKDAVTENITLYAAWEIDTFEVIFMDGETVVLTTAADYGATLTAPELDAKEHYTLAGWQDADGVYWDFENDTVTDDVILFAVWAIDTFEVTFMDGEDVIKSAVVDYGTKLTAPALGEKEHYTLTGWQDADGVYWDFDADVVTTDLTLYAVWAIDTFDVTYFVDGAPYQSLTVDYGTLLTAPDDPEKEHYTFDGWFTAEDEKWDFDTPIESDLDLYAKFSPIEFTVTFDSNGGSEVSPVTVLEGSTIEAPADPEKDNCTFAGWYKDEAFAEAWDFENDTVNASITLYARWELNACTVTFMADGEVYETGVYHSGDKIEAPDDPEKAHYIFDGWYKESTLETKWNFETDTVTSDLTLYAGFSPEEYTVAFTVEGETIKTVTVPYGEKVSAPENPSKEHYTFDGWFTAEDEKWDFTTPIESNLNLYAKFSPIEFTVTFDSNGGSEVSPVTVLEGSTIEAPADPEKAHYIFEGWFTADGDEWDFENDIVTSDITLYAGWQAVTYTVTYMVEGEEYTSVSADYATLLTAPTAPEKEHYIFEGWFTEEDAKWDFEKDTVEDNTVLYARFAPETYDVTLHTDGGIIAEGKEITSYVYGEGAVLPTASEIAKTGHDFLGWYDNADLVGDQVTAISEEDFGAKEFFAKWAPCVYDVTFVLNGGEIVEGEFASYVFGNEVALPTDVVRTGYTFRGWFDNADFEGSPVTRITSEDTGDKTFYACWEANVYALSFELNGGAADGELPVSYTYGEGLTLPTGLSRFGYAFAGWYTNAAFEGSPVTSVTPTDLGEKTFYAAWNANVYPVRLHINYGDSIKEGKDITSYTYNTEVMLPAADDLIAQGEWTFAGWYRDNGTFKIGPVEKITSSEVSEATTILNYYAKWITSSYQISYVLSGGEIHSGLVTAYTFGEGAMLPTDVTRTGYTFAGWYTNADFEGSPVTRITSEDTGDKIFYAKWTANVYQVTLNAIGGTIAEGKDITSYTYDTEVLLPTAEDMTRTGYTFAGWYANANYSGEAVTAILPGAIGNQTYFAKWDALVFSVTLHYDEDAALSSELTSYTYGVGAVLPAVTKTGYVFEGWFETAGFEGDPVTSIAADSLGDLEFFAKLTPAVYSITLITNGGTVNSGLVTSYTYGEGAILPTDITRNGYKFLGWYGASDFSGEAITEVGASETGNKTFYARWDPHTYQVTLETNGGSIAEGRDVTFYIC
ncbi:MAG: InlB B-repeat-containing protein, partial [Clostridia bacterium]|nr:InlB B-repeat-containing protein [Clostridia bacterium]